MRISTNTIFDAGVSAMNTQQTQLLKTQQQISANRRMLSPSDDPIASARALEVGQADAINSQYGVNGQAATGKLALTEQTLARVVELLQSVRESAVAAGDAVTTAPDRSSIAQDVRAMYDELLSLANSTDGEGNYLFSGYQTGVQPFSDGPAGVQYAGDDGERLVQVASNRSIAVSESGAEAFQRIRQGNGHFSVSAAGTNTGTATYGPGAVIDPAVATGHQYQIVFTVTGTAPATTTTYDVLDVTASTTVATAQTYTSGAAIVFDGIQLDVKGAPADTDKININPSTNQSLFSTISNLVNALQAPADDPAGHARLGNAITDALVNLDRGLDQVTGRRSLVGTRMREVETLQSSGEDRGIQYKEVLSKLQDLDYAKAISDLTREQTNLQAAQQSFLRVAKLSIFDYL